MAGVTIQENSVKHLVYSVSSNGNTNRLMRQESSITEAAEGKVHTVQLLMTVNTIETNNHIIG